MEPNNQQKGHRRSQTDSMLSYSLGSMSQDFLGGGNVLGGTFDDLDGVDGGVGFSTTGGDDLGPALVGNKHLRSLSFTDSRDMGDSEANNDIFIMNTNASGPPEMEPGLGHMSPPQGVPYRQKKSLRAKRPGGTGSVGPSHRRIKSMSSASTDQMMLDCFRRDPNVALNELPDLGSMSMESSDLIKFTPEDWQEAFIQIGGDSELDGMGGSSIRRSSDNSIGISMMPSSSPSKDNSRHIPLPPGSGMEHGGGKASLNQPVLTDISSSSRHPYGQGTDDSSISSNVFREFQQRKALARSSPSSEVPMSDGYTNFMHMQAQLFPPPPIHSSSSGNPSPTVDMSTSPSFQMSSSTESAQHKDRTGHHHHRIAGVGANVGIAVGKNGISEPEYHNKSAPPPLPSNFDMDKKSSNRGKYRCGRCGQPKVNHQCPYEIEASTRSISTQATKYIYDNSTHPFLTEKTIVVGKRRVVESPQSFSMANSNSALSSGVAGVHNPTTSPVGLNHSPRHVTSSPAYGVVPDGSLGNMGQSVSMEVSDVVPPVFMKQGSTSMSSTGSSGPTRPPQPSRAYNQTLAKSTSSDGSIYNEMLKDIRIVHPSMQRPVVGDGQQQHLATVSTDDSDSNSLFLSSLSSHSSATEEAS